MRKDKKRGEWKAESDAKRSARAEQACRRLAYLRFDLVREPDGIYRVMGGVRERIAGPSRNPWERALLFLRDGIREPHLDL